MNGGSGMRAVSMKRGYETEARSRKARSRGLSGLTRCGTTVGSLLASADITCLTHTPALLSPSTRRIPKLPEGRRRQPSAATVFQDVRMPECDGPDCDSGTVCSKNGAPHAQASSWDVYLSRRAKRGILRSSLRQTLRSRCLLEATFV